MDTKFHEIIPHAVDFIAGGNIIHRKRVFRPQALKLSADRHGLLVPFFSVVGVFSGRNRLFVLAPVEGDERKLIPICNQYQNQ
jgi:hypothetical protein